MSLGEFLRRLDSAPFSNHERKWFPKWLAGYTQHHRFNDDQSPIEKSLVISFLRSLRDSRLPAWRRLQAARALEAYQQLGLRQPLVDFYPIRTKLYELSRRESLIAGRPNWGTNWGQAMRRLGHRLEIAKSSHGRCEI